MALLERAIVELDQTRAREGAKLEAVLRERLDRMSRAREGGRSRCCPAR